MVLSLKTDNRLIISRLYFIANGRKNPYLIISQELVFKFFLQFTGFFYVFIAFFRPVVSEISNCLPLLFCQLPVYIHLLIMLLVSCYSDPVNLPGFVKLGDFMPFNADNSLTKRISDQSL